MKKFLTLFAVIISFCISDLAQRKAAFDPCTSKDPRVRAASKKPCPSTPTPKKNNPVTQPKGADDGDSSDDSDDSDDSSSNGKTSKKQNPPAKNKMLKNNEGDGSMFFITIEHNGEKTDLVYTQFEEHGGNAMLENERSSRLTFFYGAGNSAKNNDFLEFHGMIPTAAKGTYQGGTPGVFLGFKASKFPNVPVFLCESGDYEITAMPLPGGFVEGIFTANCIGEVHNDGSSEKYTLNGRFKVTRMT